jgi:hypothetical protein
MKRKPHLYKGLPLIDAPLGISVELEIVKSDVTGARRNDPALCAAARAAQRHFKTDVEVHLSRTYVKTKDKKAWIRYRTPEAISREIVSFDRSSQFEPGSYMLKAAPASDRLGQHKGASTPKTGAKKRRAMHFTANVRESAKATRNGAKAKKGQS